MGSGQKKAMEDYDDYIDICKQFNIQARYTNYYDHENEIIKKLETTNIYEFWSKIKKLKEEGWDLDHIKDFYKLA